MSRIQTYDFSVTGLEFVVTAKQVPVHKNQTDDFYVFIYLFLLVFVQAHFEGMMVFF